MELVVRAAVMYVVLFALIRTTGKRELAEMSAFEMVLLIVIGDVVQQGITQDDQSITGAILAAGTLTLLVLTTSYLAFRSRIFRRLVDGVAVIVVRNGQMDHKTMYAERLTEEDVLSEAREQGIESLASIRLAVLETDGRFSFITNPVPDDDSAPADSGPGPNQQRPML
jgi:uncharacterized membrane protein YcaP (DUF421 family)